MVDFQSLDQHFSAKTYARTPVVFVKGQGARLWDEQGRNYIDFGSGIGVMSLGYAHPEWVKAVSAQVASLPHTSNLYYNDKTAQLAAELVSRTGFSRVFLSNSGAEANECLIKTARKWAHDTKGEGEHPIITLVNSFHGRTITTVTATGQDYFHKYFGPFTPGFRYVQAGDLQALELALEREDCAAVLLEVVQGEGGVRALDATYLQQVYELCHKKNVLFCVDEVQTGNGRTGTWFAYEQYGLKPDLVSTAKGLGNGLPIGATLLGDRVADVLTPGSHGSTFGGNPVACAGALVVLNTIDEVFLSEVRTKSARLRRKLEQINGVDDVSGLGLMLGFSVRGATAAEVRTEAFHAGLLVLTAKDRVRLLPSLNIDDSTLDEGLERLSRAVSSAIEKHCAS